jgi:copper chaperone CopZ
MVPSLKVTLLAGAALGGTAILCPLCDAGFRAAGAQSAGVAAAHAPDTATVRLHISGMTCGSCPTTARLALKRLAGVYSATVTLDDSLGVVRYDSRLVSPTQIAAHLTRLTGFRATILPAATKASPSPGGE